MWTTAKLLNRAGDAAQFILTHVCTSKSRVMTDLSTFVKLKDTLPRPETKEASI